MDDEAGEGQRRKAGEQRRQADDKRQHGFGIGIARHEAVGAAAGGEVGSYLPPILRLNTLGFPAQQMSSGGKSPWSIFGARQQS